VSGPEVGVAISVFLASAVEAVEAVTIVLAMGLTRGWRPALTGVGAALLVLAAVVGGLGPALSALPIGVIRGVVGSLLLLFGLQWLRKAVLRYAGLKPLRDEEEEFRKLQRLGGAGGPFDRLAFTVSFKGVLLEGLEVALIVVAFAANQHHLGLATAAAGAAVVAVCAAAFAVRAPLARVPENWLKFGVGVMLCAFGSFWSAEGAGASWPGGDGALLYLIPIFALFSLALGGRLKGGAGGRLQGLATERGRP
jgi:uncharacterized membrane protein